MRIGLIIPTLNAGKAFSSLLESVSLQDITISDKIIIDSGSIDETVSLAQKYHYRVLHIATAKFNHGATRQLALEKLKNCEIAIFLTQDVILADCCSFSKLVAELYKQENGAVYGRQLPHQDADSLAAHARIFNYPPISCCKKLMDKKRLGIKTAFISNSFAAYRIDKLQAVGGFPESVVLAEDMYVAAKMLLNGLNIVYAADACAYHSHNYTITQEFKRYFATGLFQRRESWLRETFGAAEGEGFRLLKSQLEYLCENNCKLLIPKAIIFNIAKLIGYRLGLMEKYLPEKLKKKLSI